MSELPAGFVLDQPNPQQAAPQQGLPEGFVLDAAPKPQSKAYTGAIFPFRVDEQGQSHFDSNAGLLGVAKKAFVGGAELGAAALENRLDPTDETAIKKAADVAMVLGAPITPASRFALGRPNPAAVTPVARDAADMGIGLTAGQRTADPALLSAENAMHGGARGPGAQRIAQDAVARQQDEVLAARDAIGETAGRGQADLSRSADAGAVVSQGLRESADAARQGFKSKYDEAFSQPGELAPQAFQGIGGRISERLARSEEPVIVDPTLTPAATRALGELDNISNLKLGVNGQPGPGEEIVGVSLRGVDQARRKLVAYYKAAKQNPTDARAVSGIIREFDGQIEDAMQNGLFSGSDAALTALKDARSAFASYQRTFKPQGAGDDVGRAFRSIIERDATPEQVANYLYGASKVGANGLSVRMADRLKTTLGEQSPEWSAIRQGAWQRVTGVAEGKTEMGAQKMSERILEFVNGEGKSLATRLFSEEERKQMTRLANVQKAIASRSGTTNPSNSGNRLGALARESFAAIMSGIGMSAGGVPGAVAGYAGGRGATAIGNMRQTGQARQLYEGNAPLSIGRRLQESSSLAAPSLQLLLGGQALQRAIPARAETEEVEARRRRDQDPNRR